MVLPPLLLSVDDQMSAAAFHMPRLTAQRIPAPVRLRPANGVTVSRGGRDAYDYHEDSVTRGVSTRRPSRIPYAINELDRGRDIPHHLTSTPCARLPAAPVPADDQTFSRTTATWVSVFPGLRLRYVRGSHGGALSPMVSDVQAIQLFPYRLPLADTSWRPDFSACRFSPRLCVPLAFPRISGKGDGVKGLQELPSAFSKGHSSHRKTAHVVLCSTLLENYVR